MKRNLLFGLFFTILQLKAYTQNVGIGITNATQKLHVNGAIKIGGTSSLDTGTIRWNDFKKDFEGYVGDGWVSFTGSKSSWGSQEQYPVESGGIAATHGSDTAFGEAIHYGSNRLAIGISRDENGIYRHAGKVRLMKLNSLGQEGNFATIYPPNIGNYNYFGKSVATAGNLLVVGEPGAKVGDNFRQGKAHLYQLNDQNQTLSYAELFQTGINGDPEDRFGTTVAIAGDAIAVSAPDKAVGGNSKQGRVYLYQRLYLLGQPTDAFFPDTNFVAPGGVAHMQFGKALSLSPYCMVVGAPNTTVNGNVNAGKVFIYRKVNNNWQFEAGLSPNNLGSNDFFGASVAINQTGDTLVIGQPRQSSAGYVWIFIKSGNQWVYSTAFGSQSVDSYEDFGSSVDFKNGRILVGARDAAVGINNQQGKAYLYSRVGNSWGKEVTFTPQPGESYMAFGSSVQLGPNVAIVGAPGYVSQYHKIDIGKIYWYFK
ncbi:MAG TPA: hypothetical protein VFX58_09425 [Chitinophagaceae bacterium]|nr:hypothetical protein [Chitinophagaceae bacterium]